MNSTLDLTTNGDYNLKLTTEELHNLYSDKEVTGTLVFNKGNTIEYPEIILCTKTRNEIRNLKEKLRASGQSVYEGPHDMAYIEKNRTHRICFEKESMKDIETLLTDDIRAYHERRYDSHLGRKVFLYHLKI